MRSALAPSLVAVLVLGFVSHAFAREENIDCGNAMSTYEMNLCADRDYQAADKQLNVVYKDILRELAKDSNSKDSSVRDDAQERLKRLVASQRAWVTYRETNSQLQGIEALGGTAETVSVIGSATQLTNERVKELKELFGTK